MECECQEVVPPHAHNGIFLDLGPGKKPEAAGGKCNAGPLKSKRNAAANHAFDSDDCAQREKHDPEPTHGAIHNIGTPHGHKPRHRNQSTAGHEEGELSLGRIAKLKPFRHQRLQLSSSKGAVMTTPPQ